VFNYQYSSQKDMIKETSNLICPFELCLPSIKNMILTSPLILFHLSKPYASSVNYRKILYQATLNYIILNASNPPKR